METLLPHLVAPKTLTPLPNRLCARTGPPHEKVVKTPAAENPNIIHLEGGLRTRGEGEAALPAGPNATSLQPCATCCAAPRTEPRPWLA